MKKFRGIVSVIILLGLIGFSCEKKIEESVSQESVKASGPQTEQINEEDYAIIYYVADNAGSDDNGDGSKEKPWASVNYALSQVLTASVDSRVAILVSGGDYSKSTIQMKEYVDLYGGFSEKDWIRDIDKNIIFGDEDWIKW